MNNMDLKKATLMVKEVKNVHKYSYILILEALVMNTMMVPVVFISVLNHKDC